MKKFAFSILTVLVVLLTFLPLWAVEGYISNIKTANSVDSPGAGSYGSAQTVSITDATGDAYICYTTDGTIPTITYTAGVPSGCGGTGTHYTGTFMIAATTTLKHVAQTSRYNISAVQTSTYTITGGGGTPPDMLTGLTLWYEADTGLTCSGGCSGTNDVTGWADQSGGSHDIVSCPTPPNFVATGSSGFSNTKPAIHFTSAGSEFCLIPSTAVSKFNATMIVLIRSSSWSGGAILGASDAGPSLYPGDTATVFKSMNTINIMNSSTYSSLGSTWHVLGMSYCGANGAGGNTGVFTVDNTTQGTPTPAIWDYFGVPLDGLGATRATGSTNGFYNGDVAAVAVYASTCHTDTEMKAVFTYWQGKYGF